MRWWRWLRLHRNRNGAAAAALREEAERKLAAAQKMTPMVEHMARRVAKLPPDEFANRVAKAFNRRPA